VYLGAHFLLEGGSGHAVNEFVVVVPDADSMQCQQMSHACEESKRFILKILAV